jgi:hypothetical protein
VSVDAGILRYVHFTKWGDFIVDPQVIVPFGHQKVDASRSSSSGLGDVIFGGTLWTTAELNGRKNDDNLMLTLASFLAKQWQFQLQYHQDLHVENALKGHGAKGRLVYAF